MKLIITVPFLNTPENRRHGCVMRTLVELRRQVYPPHVLMPVDNGSSDTRCWEWIREMGMLGIRIAEPMSISQGVNAGWRPWEDELSHGKAAGVKFDSDMIADDGWIEAVSDALDLHFSQEVGGSYMGQLGLRVMRHPNPPPDDAPRLPGGVVRVSFLHGAVVARTPFGFSCIGYEKHPFLPELLPQNADMSLPWGRWGYGDHWTSQRLRFAGLGLGMLVDYVARGHFGDGSISRETKAKIAGVGRRSLDAMLEMLGNGEIGPYQEYDGPEEVEYACDSIR